jgi:hypothetical protein
MLSDFTRNRNNFFKLVTFKFNENPFDGSGVITYRQAERSRDIMKLLRLNFATFHFEQGKI